MVRNGKFDQDFLAEAGEALRDVKQQVLQLLIEEGYAGYSGYWIDENPLKTLGRVLESSRDRDSKYRLEVWCSIVRIKASIKKLIRDD